MRVFRASASLILLMGCSDTAARRQDRMMEEIERKVTLPPKAFELDQYARYYASDGRRVVATYVRQVDGEDDRLNLAVGQRHWTKDQSELPITLDGGCSVVHVLFDPVAHKVERTFCNGLA